MRALQSEEKGAVRNRNDLESSSRRHWRRELTIYDRDKDCVPVAVASHLHLLTEG